jgi:ElaB/YqjD/DUF883 family membrane-anchored ribosome-binding protein
MTTTADLTSTLHHAANHIRDDARQIGATALNAARDQVLVPAKQAAAKASDYAHEAYDETRLLVAKHAGQASDLARHQMDRAWKWASANPLAAIGLAFAAGLVLAKTAHSSSSH